MSQLCLSKVILKQSAEVLGFISLFGDFSGAVFPFLAGCSITGKSISPPPVSSLVVAVQSQPVYTMAVKPVHPLKMGPVIPARVL